MKARIYALKEGIGYHGYYGYYRFCIEILYTDKIFLHLLIDTIPKKLTKRFVLSISKSGRCYSVFFYPNKVVDLKQYWTRFLYEYELF